VSITTFGLVGVSYKDWSSANEAAHFLPNAPLLNMIQLHNTASWMLGFGSAAIEMGGVIDTCSVESCSIATCTVGL
jgi:hypothetical protein